MNGPPPAEAGDFRLLMLLLTMLVLGGGVMAWAGSRPGGENFDELVVAVARAWSD